jgi:hypothetical protein
MRYDAHIHFYFSFPAEELKRVFRRLAEIGLAGFSALVFVEFPRDIETVLKMVPGAYHDKITLPVLERQQEPFPYFAWARPLTVVPFADVRFMEHDIEAKMERLRQQGYQGIKLLYVPEEDRAIHVEGMERAFGWPVQKSEAVTARLIESAASRGMRVLIHVDLRRYGDFVKDMLRSHPTTNFNIPHFGSSRKALSPFLETFPNCYSDTSALVPVMEKEPEAYRSFIERYQDRILFGSDALMDMPEEQVASSLHAVERLLDDEGLFQKLTCTNYMAFHGGVG